MDVSSEPVAGDRVADRQREEAEPNGEQDEVQHRLLLAARVSPTKVNALGRDSSLRYVNNANDDRAARAPMNCHLSHMFSRGIGRQRYRNLIKMQCNTNLSLIILEAPAVIPRGSMSREQSPFHACEIRRNGRRCPAGFLYEIPIFQPSNPSGFPMTAGASVTERSQLQAAG